MSAGDYHQFINRHLPMIERGCTSKALFISRREAQSLARNGRRRDGRLRPYHCAICGGWHLGHQRRMQLATWIPAVHRRRLRR